MITNIFNTIQKTFTDGFGPKPVAMLPANSKHDDVYVSPDLPAFNGRFFSQEVTRLATSDEHRAILREALQKAARRVVIVSPFITVPAITADGIHDLVRAAVLRGVTVSIYADDRLNLDIHGREIRQVLGVVTGRSTLEAATHLEQEVAEQEALAALMVNALNMGANAVVDLRLSNSTHEQTYTKWMVTMTCYSGTAVDIN